MERKKQTWNELRDEAYLIACDHGWHDEELSDDHCLMLVVTEVAEAVEADRKNMHAHRARFESDMTFQMKTFRLYGASFDRYHQDLCKAYLKDTVEDELADVVIRLLDLAGLRGIDLSLLDEICAEGEYIIGGSDMMKVEQCRVNDLSFCEWCIDFVREYIVNINYDLTNSVMSAIVAVFIRAKAAGFDLMWHITTKMEYNKRRERKHGKAY